MEIEEILDRIDPMPQSSQQKLIQELELITVPKGHLLMSADRLADQVYFIRKGVVRAYVLYQEREVTFWFGQEGDIAMSMNSFTIRKAAFEFLEALESTEVYAIAIETLQDLYRQDLYLANWGRKFAESELRLAEERFTARQFKTARERYEDFLNNYPGLLQRVQLGYIASYLGISQVSLSRIRMKPVGLTSSARG